MAGAIVGGFSRGKMLAQSGSSWEGWNTSRDRKRPMNRMGSQDSGLNLGVREGLTSEFRDLQQKFPIVGNICRNYATYCVGSCEAVWNTGDAKIDEAYEHEWRNAMNIMDANGEDHFVNMTQQAVMESIGMGQIFGQMLDANGFLQIRLIESDRVGNYRNGYTNFDEDGIVGGILLNRGGSGRRLAARVWQRKEMMTISQYVDPQDVPWSDIVHLVQRWRPDAVTGVTPFAPVLNTIRDLKETKDDEQLAQKIFSRIILHAKLRSGPAGGSTGITLQQNDSTDTPGGAASTPTPDLVDVARGAIFFGYPDEELSALVADRPTAGWQWFMEFLIAEIAMALDLPYSVVWKMADLPGPAVRFDISKANRTFLRTIDNLEKRWFRKIRGVSIAKAINNRRVPWHPLWYVSETITPASITIDLGREGKLGLEEIDAGAGTITDYVGEAGKRAKNIIRRRAQEEKWIDEAAKEFKVEPERIRRPTQTAAMVTQQNAAPERKA